MCLYPRLIKNKKYTENKKNGGNVPICRDKRTLLVPVGCGSCMECRAQETRKWQTRLLEDIRTNKNGKFVTLTFSNESIKKITRKIKGVTGYELDNQIATIAVKQFINRWRKTHKKSVRHWLVTELGHTGTENIHMHGILWTNETNEEIKQKWKYGYVWIGDYVNEKTVNYIVKYIKKQDKDHKEYKSKILTSSGIGANYINRIDSKRNRYKEKETNETYTTRQGIKTNLPIYYRNKIYSDEERENLWIERLDKQERWVGGERIDISTKQGEKEYFEALEYYRKKNKRLGYGDNKKNWERVEYENNLRKLKLEERIEDVWEDVKEERKNILYEQRNEDNWK